MSTIIEATFDGEVFRPTEPINLPPNTKVQIIVNGNSPPKPGEPYSVLRFMQSANIDGPADWSENVDRYLYGEELHGDG